MATLTYDKLPEDCDVYDLADKADYSLDYLGKCVWQAISQGIRDTCTFPPFEVTMHRDRSFVVRGSVVDFRKFPDIRLEYEAYIRSGKDHYKIDLYYENYYLAHRECPLDTIAVVSATMELMDIATSKYV